MENIHGRNNLLIWEMIKYAKSKGIETFDLGGIATDPEKRKESGVSFFKLSFGGKVTPVFHYEKINSKKYVLLQAAEKARSKGLLPDFVFRFLH